MINYAGQTILVTGGASGIGKAMAEAFVARGAEVIIADVQSEAAGAVAARLNGHAIACDLSDPAAPANLIEAAWAWKGKLDFVCANAGTGVRNPVLKENFGPATERVFAVNMRAPILMAQAFAAKLEAAGTRGRLMITSSENALSLPAGVRRWYRPASRTLRLRPRNWASSCRSAAPRSPSRGSISASSTFRPMRTPPLICRRARKAWPKRLKRSA